MTENLAFAIYTPFSTRTLQLQFMVSSYPLVNSRLTLLFVSPRVKIQRYFIRRAFLVPRDKLGNQWYIISLAIQTEKLQIDHQKKIYYYTITRSTHAETKSF